jgi:uncharacterized protein
MHELSRGVHVLQPEDYRRMRWKNGRGMTMEIAVSPANASLDRKPFDWRVSIAEVETDCEFSRFPGYDRSLTLIEGAGMELSIDSAPSQRIDKLHVPIDFKGESQIYSHLLNGPVRDFNVMSRRDKCKHTCEVFTAPSSIHQKPDTQILLIFSLNGGFSLGGLLDHPIDIKMQETLIVHQHIDQPMDKNFRISAVSPDMVVVIVNISEL